MTTRSILLPQTITIIRRGETLLDAVRVRDFPDMRDSRDVPHTRDMGRPRRSRRYDTPSPNGSLPLYDGSIPALGLYRDYGGEPELAIEIIPVTQTPMSPDVAEAFVDLLAFDPEHPFVKTHLDARIGLNGSDSYFAVGGAALAIPLTRLPEEANARRRKGYVPPEPDGDERDLPVHVSAWRGLRDDDFIAAAQRHESLSPDEILIGTLHRHELEAIRHSHGGEGLSGREKPMFKLSVEGVTKGFFGTHEEAGAALDAAMESIKYRDGAYLSTPRHRSLQGESFKIEGCLVEDGVEVQRQSVATLVEAKAVVRGTVAKVAPGPGAPVAAWLFAWQADDWHRGGVMLEQELDLSGSVVRQYQTSF